MRWLHTVGRLLVSPGAAAAAATVLLDGTIGTPSDGWPIAVLPLAAGPDSSVSSASSGSGNGRSLGAAEDEGEGTSAPEADGSAGIFEAYLSSIDSVRGGSQKLCLRVRTDCVAQAAGALAIGSWDGTALADQKAATTAAALLDFLFLTSPAQQGPRGGDPRTNALAGVLLWGTNTPALPSGEELFGDDQYRSLIAAAFAASSLMAQQPSPSPSPSQSLDRWNDGIARLLLGNARVVGPLGYTYWLGNSESELVEHGWRHFRYELPVVHELQYYQAATRAGNLWGYAVTRNASLFLDRTVAGLNQSMAAFYNGQWLCQVGATSELARMVLPLAWLIRVRDSATSRKWLRDVVTALLRYQKPSGAIQEDPYGWPAHRMCGHAPPSSNSRYGTFESTLSQNASDPVSDLLYSSNFAMMGQPKQKATQHQPKQ
jgi:hypothetical protein